MKVYTSIVVALLFSSNFIFSQCIDNTLINPMGMCPLQYDPICGCNGKTYQNACLAQITDGVMMGSPGACPMELTYTVCEGESIEIGLPTPIPMAQYNWNPPDALSCLDCANPILTTTLSSTIELEVIDSTSMSSFYYFEVMVDNNCPAACIDTTLIDPDGVCTLLYDPVCGCNGKTYSNSCFAGIQGGATSWTAGDCPITQSYTICSGDSIQIGLSGGLSDATYTWQPTNDLSCLNCENPFASPIATIIYELSVLSALDQSVTYQYYEVVVETCVLPCQDDALIEPNPACDQPNDPVCGCDGRTYSNACLAEKAGGLNEWVPGACSITQTYNVCEGDSLQIGISGGLSDVTYTWQPTNDLSCLNCENPFASPIATTVYELSILSTLDESVTYQYYEVEVDICVLLCQDDALIEPNPVCNVPNDPVCGCDGRTYVNACLAEKAGGLNEWAPGACSITQTYDICEGDNIQIGLAGAIGNTVLSWQPLNTLSCSNCPNPFAMPSQNTIYELEIFTTTDASKTYQYYEVIVDQNCANTCTNNDISFTYEQVENKEVGNPINYGANVYCFKETSGLDNVCNYFWNFGNGATIPSRNPCNLEFEYIKNGQPVADPTYTVCLTMTYCDGSFAGSCCADIVSSAPVCDCDNISAPVCGVDGNTYTNACTAACDFVNVAYTGSCCDIYNLPWLDEALFDMCNDCVSKVEFIEYAGSNYIAFWADNVNCSDAITTIYNCDGTVFCQSGGIAGLNECSDVIGNYTVIESVWDKEVQCGLCGFDSALQVDWLHGFIDGSTSINTYFYNNEIVFNVESCDNAGLNYVLSCDSTVVCTSLNDCPGFLTQAAYIDEIIPCPCVDISLLDSTPSCPPFYAPVCGCDGITYSNFCLAKAQGGVTSWTAGACSSSLCLDTVLISGQFLGSGTYKANLALQVETPALDGHSINLRAGESIELMDGFSIPKNTNLSILDTYCY